MNVEASEFEEKLKKTLRSLGLGHWTICWLPDLSHPVRGKTIPEKLQIEIYEVDEDEAWNTFLHELRSICARGALMIIFTGFLLSVCASMCKKVGFGSIDRNMPREKTMMR